MGEQVDVYIWFEFAHELWKNPFTLSTTETSYDLLELGGFFMYLKVATAVMIGYAVHKREDQEHRDASRLRRGQGEYIYNRDGIIARKFYWR